jgi:LemA protein
MPALLLFLIIIGVAVFYAVGLYNNLVTLRNRCDNAWAQVDVQLKRRYDLIPNLIETVKGYAAHEREVFQKVTEARAAAISATGIKDQGAAENALSGALKSLFAVAEA